MEDLAGLKTPFRPHGGSPRATRPASTTARPPASSPPRRPPRSSACRSRCGWSPSPSSASSPRSWAIGPVPAAEKALAKAGLSIDDIGLFELNEAFAVQVLAFLEHFGIADDARGSTPTAAPSRPATRWPPPGAADEPARPQFEEHPEVRYGLTAMCIGIGMGGTVIWENPHHADYGKEN
jgi:acetyl-CoA acyltransferase